MSVVLHIYFYLKEELTPLKGKSFLRELKKEWLIVDKNISYFDIKKEENIFAPFEEVIDKYVNKQTEIFHFNLNDIEFTISLNQKDKYIFFSMNSFFLNKENHKKYAEEIIKKIKRIINDGFEIESVKESLD